jgi:putative photosynthetic complex assembly protein 2
LTAYGLPIVATLFAWWFSTGAILYLDGLPRRTFRWSFGAASLIALAALWGLAATADQTGAAGAYLAVLCAVLLWGWNEMAFLFGYITGPRREPCPPDATGFARFSCATRAILHHELALLACLLLVAVLTWGGANPFGLMTFALLFAMRLSTKLNIYLGVPNTTVEFLPGHLAYLKSYFRQKPMNLLFPFSATLSTLLTAWLVHEAALGDPALATGFVLLATLAALGVIEHWFLVVPLPVAGLWSWGLRSHERALAQPSTAKSAPRAVPPPARIAPEPATPRAISPSSLVA